MSKKRILITGGPTNEYIDEVMKITNMSSGKISIQMAQLFAKNNYRVTLMLTKTIKYEPQSALIDVVRFETTQELYEAILHASRMNTYDAVIHSAAVADYKPEYSFRMEDMAQEIADWIDENRNVMEVYHPDDLYNIIFDILTNPQCKVNDSTKISSVESNLTVKLGLTPKIIASLREWFPNSLICGFKLLENVTEDELSGAATNQIEKCHTDLVFANDLAKLRRGEMTRLVVGPDGVCNIAQNGAEDIVRVVLQKLNH